MVRHATMVSLLVAAQAVATADDIVPSDWLALPRASFGGRSAIHVDAVEAAIVAGERVAPAEGDTVEIPGADEPRAWMRVEPNEEGWLSGRELSGAYAYTMVESDTEQAMILDASGHSVVYVNGVPRGGDWYGTGWTMTPVVLRAGANDLLFRVARGRLRAKLAEPKAAAFLNLRDPTLPDLVLDEKTDTHAAAIIVNATQEWLRDCSLAATLPGGRINTRVPPIPPLGTRKVGFRLKGAAPQEPGEIGLELRLATRGRELDAGAVQLRAREPSQTRKRTFISNIDGSVQYYAVNPARPEADDAGAPGLILTTHGASVEAIGQADAYAPKRWAHLVAPTNRRPYGFDWEDWGRIDAMEVLEIARKSLGTDPRRTYLTGHSMGGHGAWHLGVTYPDRWAAIGPSAAWVSFSTYGRRRGEEQGEPTPVEEMLARAGSPSDTLNRARNTLHHGVYILHGEKDDNVGVSQARAMRDELSGFHRDFIYHEEPGAGHWWDNSDEPGAACVDWPEMMDFFSRRQIPGDREVRDIEFTTPAPAISASSHWLRIEAQVKQLAPSTVTARCDPWTRRFVGTTENVLRMSFSLAHLKPGERVKVILDGQEIRRIDWPEGEPRIWIERVDGEWALVAQPSLSMKGPHRAGPFKEAFRHGFAMVYGTRGTDEENAWALAKARLDQELFWYRGNGSADVLPDAEFDPRAEPDRSAILYGNAETNGAWAALLGDSPVQVRAGVVELCARNVSGDDLVCVFVQPRPGSDTASVGVVGGTGIKGMRLADRLSYFLSGAAFPDCLVVSPRMLTEGAKGILAAGFFGQDWSVDRGEFVFAE